jgi:hypothetical protein
MYCKDFQRTFIENNATIVINILKIKITTVRLFFFGICIGGSLLEYSPGLVIFAIQIKLMLKNSFNLLQKNILLTPAYVYFGIVAHNNHATFPTPVLSGMIQVNKK